MSFLFQGAQVRRTSHGWALLLAAFASACSAESLCSNGGCAEPEGTDAGFASASVSTSASAEPDSGMTLATTSATEVTLPEMSSSVALSDAGHGGAPSLDAGNLDASVAASSTAATLDAAMSLDNTAVTGDGAVVGVLSEAGPPQTDECVGCGCPNQGCFSPTPICGPGGVCVTCNDADDLGCSGTTPWCKAAVDIEDNRCVQCRTHLDCHDDSFPACEMDQCVPCSIADNKGCSEEAPLCVHGPADDVDAGTTATVTDAGKDAGTDAGTADGGSDASASNNGSSDDGSGSGHQSVDSSNNHCVQCASSDDCGGDTPICEDSVCIPCATRSSGGGADFGCANEAAPRCLAGDEPTENACVQCLGNPDCDAQSPLCNDVNACVQCLGNANCADNTAPHCDDSGSCSGCESDNDCSKFNGAQECDVASGACVECTSDDHCLSPGEAACGEDFTCGACNSNSDCTHLDDLGVCNAGQCVECTVQDESACGLNSCNPATNTCTGTPRGSVGTCETCAADSECTSDSYRCVPMNFNGASHGNYCMRRQSAGCGRPYLSPLSAGSLSGAGQDDYCGINQDLTTCEAVLDLQQSVGCQSAADCGNGQGGLCKTVGIAANRCTYSCGSADQCTGSYVCDDNSQGGAAHCH